MLNSNYRFALLLILTVLLISAAPLKYRNYRHPAGFAFDIPATWRIVYSKRQEGLICVPTTKLDKGSFADCFEGIIFRMTVYHVGLDSALHNSGLYTHQGHHWYTTDRVSNSVTCKNIKGKGWIGLWHENVCGIGCSDGFHAVAGQCDNLWCSDGRITVAIETNGYPFDAAVLNRIKNSIRFYR